MKAKYVLVMVFMNVVLAYSQSFEGFRIGASYEELKAKIPAYATIKKDDIMKNEYRIEFTMESLGDSRELSLFFYKGILVSTSRRYSEKLLDRIVNALNRNYGVSKTKGIKLWQYNGVDIYIFELKEEGMILLAYDLKIGLGEEYFEKLLTGGNCQEDSLHL